MNDLIRPSFYDAYHRIIPLRGTRQRASFGCARDRQGAGKVDVVGPICESGDFFAKDRRLPKLKEGDFVAIMSTGAYGFSMSSNYNSRRRAQEVMVVKDKVFVIRKRESYEDLARNEIIPAFLLGI